MNRLLRILTGCVLFCSPLLAEVAPVEVKVPETKAWIGQRVPFYVELRSPGSFASSPVFDLPQIPGTIVLKIGNPVVGSRKIEGKDWAIQTHEFALFSQRSGTLKLPTFNVRFSQRGEFTGPASDVKEQAKGFNLEIQRPPDSENIAFLVTTESLDIRETWDPQPGPAEVGAVFKRTITQRATQIPGMALSPPPTVEPDGLRIYTDEAETSDELHRGDFLGERRDTITYMVLKPGTLEIPPLIYTWWNPKTETLESFSLPAVRVEIAPAPASEQNQEAASGWNHWIWLVAIALLAGAVGWKWRSLRANGLRFYRFFNPPQRVAKRKLIKACRRNNSVEAASAWIEWCSTRTQFYKPSPELAASVLDLQSHLFGRSSYGAWRGAKLLDAFNQDANDTKPRRQARTSLPALNPNYEHQLKQNEGKLTILL